MLCTHLRQLRLEAERFIAKGLCRGLGGADGGVEGAGLTLERGILAFQLRDLAPERFLVVPRISASTTYTHTGG